MNSTFDIENLKTEFKKQYNDTFLFAPSALQDVLYVDSQLRLEGAEGTLNLNELCDKVIKGVERSFLILGDSGSGKTSFALKLCHTLWGKYSLGDTLIIPIYIYLPTLVTKLNQNDDSAFNVRKTLVEEFGLNGIERWEGKIVLILDSFDEISSFPHRSRIVKNIWNNTSCLPSWRAEVSVLTCSRPEAVPKLERQDMFEFVKTGHERNRKYSEYTLEGLSGDTIDNFLKKMDTDIITELRKIKDVDLTNYLAWKTLKSNIQDWKSGDYKQWFLDIPDLRKLSENPYVLILICQALPGTVHKLKKEKEALPGTVLKPKEEKELLKKLCKTRVGIFRLFTEQIFVYQAERVSQRPDNLKPGAQTILYRDWLAYFRAYAQNLAGKFFNYGNEESVVKVSEEETLNSSLVEPVLNIEQMKRLEKDHKDLFPPRLTHYEEVECRTVENANTFQKENMKILRDACNGSILVHSVNEKNKNEYTFIHRSMLEYFASEQAFEGSLAEYDLILGQNMKISEDIYGETGFGRVLIKHRDILNLLVQRMSFAYKEILFKLIPVSKKDSKLHRISANAITILNKAQVCFSGQDYRDIQIQGADLRQSICECTDFRGANLTDVQFGESYLIGAQFQGACMEGTDFGESPILKLSADLTSMVSYREHENTEDTWVVGTRDGAVRIWNTVEDELVVPQCRETSCVIETRLALLDKKVAVWGENSNYSEISNPSTMVTYEVSLYDLFPKWKFIRKHTFQTTEGVDQVYVQFRPIDKCVFIYSTCHLEVLSYLPAVTEKLVTIIGVDPIRIVTFASIVDKNSDILIACRKNCGEGVDGRIDIYKYDKGSQCFEIVHTITTKQFSGSKGDYSKLDRLLFKPDGSGLAIYNADYLSLKIFDISSETITPAHSDLHVFFNLAFDMGGKYLAVSTISKIIIWNMSNGSIHRQFGYAGMLYPSRFSNPLMFSSNSEELAFVGSASYYHPTMKLSSIDENPSIHDDLSNSKSIDHVAVSDDGKLVVIVGYHSNTSDGLFHYIETFDFPFQSSSGRFVRLSVKSKYVDRCLVGITNSKCVCSKNSEISKKIIVIQPKYCRAFVVCSKSGNILQDVRFEEALDVNTNILSCVNKQTSMFCIYSPTQGYFLWEIFENENSEINFGMKPELKLLNETDMKLNELSFDYTGRFLQIVSAHLDQTPKMSKIKIIDTLEKSVEELKLPLNADIKLPIERMDTDMSNNIIFSCSGIQLFIFSFDNPLYQRVDYKDGDGLLSTLQFAPLSGWLFATCYDRSFAIFKKDEASQWRRALEIPLWFTPNKCVCYEMNKNNSVLLSGEGNLCYIEFDKEDCNSWRLLWSMTHCYKLIPLSSNVEGSLCLSKRNAGVLKGHGAMGTPHQNNIYRYLPFSDWCQEILGTARSKLTTPKPFIKAGDNNLIISEDMWVVSLVGNVTNILNWRAHVYFIVEGIKNKRRFITRIHLTYSKKLKEVSIVVSPVVDRNSVSDHSLVESKYFEFIDFADILCAQQYGMSNRECDQFLRNIQSDMQVKLDYNLLFNNCAVWCEEHLKKVGRDVSLQGFTFALIFSRVLKFIKEMRFRKSLFFCLFICFFASINSLHVFMTYEN